MRAIKFALAAIFAVLIVILLFANGDNVVVKYWPDMTGYGLPASPSHSVRRFGVAFVAGIIGFALGSLREYLREGAIRRDRARTKKEAAALKAERDAASAAPQADPAETEALKASVADLQARLDDAERARDAAIADAEAAGAERDEALAKAADLEEARHDDAKLRAESLRDGTSSPEPAGSPRPVEANAPAVR